jgi:hypothetical protein
LTVSREQALALSVIANARSLIVSVVAQLSVDRLRDDVELDPGTLLTQPDPDSDWPNQIGWTVDDLIFYGESNWLVLRRDADGWPTRARRLPAGSVAVQYSNDYGQFSRILAIRVGGSDINQDDLIRFQMPHHGVLRDGASLILQSLTLTAAAQKFATVALPAGVLTNTGQEIGPKDAADIVEAFDAARESGATAFLQSMTYERTQLNSADLQLVEALAAMDTRLARLMNVPVAMIAASPSGGAHTQLYANVPQNLTQLVQQCVAPYLVACEAALTLAVPRSQRVAFATGDWLRFAMVSMPVTAPAGTPPLTPGGQTE